MVGRVALRARRGVRFSRKARHSPSARPCARSDAPCRGIYEMKSSVSLLLFSTPCNLSGFEVGACAGAFAEMLDAVEALSGLRPIRVGCPVLAGHDIGTEHMPI